MSALELARRDAILASQLHSFTGMFFGKDPTEVSEAELHSFLRVFVFFPAIFASLAATALALASVTPLRKVVDPIEVDDMNLVDHLLTPLTRSVDDHARIAANEAVAKAMAAHRIEPAAPSMAADQPAVAASPAAGDGAPMEATRPDDGRARDVRSDEGKAEDGKDPDLKGAEYKPVAPMRPTLVASNPPAPLSSTTP